jgi:hypothetical protein
MVTSERGAVAVRHEEHFVKSLPVKVARPSAVICTVPLPPVDPRYMPATGANAVVVPGGGAGSFGVTCTIGGVATPVVLPAEPVVVPVVVADVGVAVVVVVGAVEPGSVAGIIGAAPFGEEAGGVPVQKRDGCAPTVATRAAAVAVTATAPTTTNAPTRNLTPKSYAGNLVLHSSPDRGSSPCSHVDRIDPGAPMQRDQGVTQHLVIGRTDEPTFPVERRHLHARQLRWIRAAHGRQRAERRQRQLPP